MIGHVYGLAFSCIRNKLFAHGHSHVKQTNMVKNFDDLIFDQ